MSKYREIFEKIPDGITLHDASTGTILDANQEFCEMLGYDQAELLELGFDALHVDEPPYTSDRAEAYIQKAATEGPQTFEWVDQTKTGEPLPVEVHLRRTAIDDQEAVLAVVRDITERREQEEELERKTERLESFASILSHDLQNPLQVAQGHLELAQEECDSDHLEPIERAHQRMQALISDLLELAREGNTAIEITPVALDKLAEQCWRNVETADATLDVTCSLTIRADTTRLSQLLENLIRNSVTHAGPDVTITIGDLTDGFYVEDDGPGIPADDREAVFESGYSSTPDGTGFGLSIVRRVVEAHGWTIRLLEAADGGARFEVTGVESAE